MLLWVLILAIFGALVAALARDMPDILRAATLAVQGWIAAAFLLFILLTSDPFARVNPAPFEGHDLNPLLQDPGLAIHPPMLYLGYVGFSIVFLLRGGGADHRAGRRRMGPLRAALGAAGLDLPHARDRDGLLLGLLHARLGRVLVSGTRSRTPRSCPGSPAPRCSIARS